MCVGLRAAIGSALFRLFFEWAGARRPSLDGTDFLALKAPFRVVGHGRQEIVARFLASSDSSAKRMDRVGS